MQTNCINPNEETKEIEAESDDEESDDDDEDDYCEQIQDDYLGTSSLRFVVYLVLF